MKKIVYEYNGIKKNTRTKLLVKGIYKDDKIDDFLKSFGGSANEIVINAIKINSFKCSYGKFISIFTNPNDERSFKYGDPAIDNVLLVGLGNKEKLTNDKLRALGAKISDRLNDENILNIDSDSFNLDVSEKGQSFSEGLILGTYSFLNYKSKKENKNKLEKINFYGSPDIDSIDKGKAIGYAVHYSRDLGNHPANVLTPEYMADMAVELSSKCKLMTSKIIDVKDFVKMGFGSFYSVAKASVLPAKMILIEYNGGNKGDKPLALVGKGLTFDTGGISLKPPTKMDEMKFDMCGSGTVLGVMHAVAKLQPKINIIFAIGATENMPGGNATRPGDIVTAYNGKTIEVLNTDAEGRLVLADVLSYVADKYNPGAMIDFATLTGAVLIALGDRSSGIMGNDEDLLNQVKVSSDNTGERVWELPLWKEYSKDIKSNIADIKNLGRGRLAGTISAGAFLKEFVGDIPWVHMDIAGTAWGPKEPSYMPKHGATGVAVRLIYDLIENKLGRKDKF